MPAPWTGAGKLTSDVSIYTPPGYDPDGSLAYPVLYEAPTGLTLWSSSGAGVAQFDALIDSGAMPAAIVVFIDESNPPLSPSECVDSDNGQQWFESYISNKVVNYVDENYRTIVDPRARAIMGMSEGGFCSAMLALRHPEVYRFSISFSGYFWAGTPDKASARPYGNQADLDAHSPALLAPQIPVTVRSMMYFIVVANHGQEFFGPQALDFDAVLAADGYRYLAVNSPYGHGWDEVQLETPNALAVWGEQLVINGIW
jgi:enterochelin esterase-like enzyme